MARNEVERMVMQFRVALLDQLVLIDPAECRDLVERVMAGDVRWFRERMAEAWAALNKELKARGIVGQGGFDKSPAWNTLGPAAALALYGMLLAAANGELAGIPPASGAPIPARSVRQAPSLDDDVTSRIEADRVVEASATGADKARLGEEIDAALETAECEQRKDPGPAPEAYKARVIETVDTAPWRLAPYPPCPVCGEPYVGISRIQMPEGRVRVGYSHRSRECSRYEESRMGGGKEGRK